MKNRTYWYFEGQPLYPFGHGRSYSTFEYGPLELCTSELQGGNPLDVGRRKCGKRDGDEGVELYIGFPRVAGVPLRCAHSAAFI